MTVLAVLALATAVTLLAPPPPRVGPRPRRRVGRGWLPGLAAAAAVALAAGTPPRVLALLAVAGGVAAAGSSAGRRSRRRRAAAVTSERVLEACEQLAAELAAGLPPGTALLRAADAWPALAPVAEAWTLGSDVPDAFRALALRPGAGDLRHVAAAWDVAHRTGQGFADAVNRVSLGIRADHATRRLVASELASARATARLLAGLPVLALAMGSGVGGNPWRFLLVHPLGLLFLASGLALELAGLRWVEAIADRIEGRG